MTGRPQENPSLNSTRQSLNHLREEFEVQERSTHRRSRKILQAGKKIEALMGEEKALYTDKQNNILPNAQGAHRKLSINTAIREGEDGGQDAYRISIEKMEDGKIISSSIFTTMKGQLEGRVTSEMTLNTKGGGVLTIDDDPKTDEGHDLLDKGRQIDEKIEQVFTLLEKIQRKPQEDKERQVQQAAQEEVLRRLEEE